MNSKNKQTLWLLILTAIVGALVINRGVLAQEPTATGADERIVRYDAALRGGPGPTFPIAGKIGAGERVTINAVSEDGFWAQLDDGNWIAMVLLTAPTVGTPTAQPTATGGSRAETARQLIPTATTTITPSQQITVTLLNASAFTTTLRSVLRTTESILRPTATTTQRLQPIALRNANLRAGPGTNYAVVGGVQTDDPLDIVGQNSDGTWLQLRDEAWIAAFLVDQPLRPLPTVDPSLIAAVPTAAPTTTPTPQPTEAPTVVPPINGDTTELPPTSGDSAATPADSGQGGATGTATFVVTRRRLWNAWENGGSMDGPSVHCGQGRNLVVNVLDENGNRLNGVAVQAEYGAKEIHVTGAQGKGDGVVEFVLGGGQDIRVIRDSDGSPVQSEVARGLATDPRGIDQESLMSAGYCQDDTSCRTYINNLSCIGHYSWTVNFERRR